MHRSTFLIVTGLLLSTTPLLLSQDLKQFYVAVSVEGIFLRDSEVKPQEVDSFVAVCEKHGVKLTIGAVPHRLVEDQNKNGGMAASLKKYRRRGHLIAMNGYKFQCSRCGQLTHEYYCTTDSVMLPDELESRELAEGKGWLERAIDSTVTTYIAPGTDDGTSPQTQRILRTLGFREISSDSIDTPMFKDTVGYIPRPFDLIRDLQDSTFASTLAQAKREFVSAASHSNYFSFAAHDDGTRKNYHHAIALKWVDEFLSFIESFPHLEVHYVTAQNLRKEWFAPSPH